MATVHARDDQGAEARAASARHALQAATAGQAGGHALHGGADQFGVPGRAAEPAAQEASGNHPQARESAQRGVWVGAVALVVSAAGAAAATRIAA